MVQIEDHKMRSECAKEFGAIQKSLEFHGELRRDQSAALQKIQVEIEKLTGNGNRGKIDDLSLRLQNIEKLLVDQVARFDASQLRIEHLEEFTEELEKRIYSTALKMASAIGAVTVIIHFIMSKWS